MKVFPLKALLMLVVGCVAIPVPAQDLKQFLNIRAPKTALHAPIVFKFKGSTALVGLYYRNRNRDVSALRLDDGEWKPLGRNGDAITGVGGNFISDFSIDANGIPWFLTYYTRPSNSDRADRFFLYTIRDDEWVLIGPPDGHKADLSGDEIMFFLEGSPVLSYRTWNPKTQTRYSRLFAFQRNKWIEKPADGLMPPISYIQLHLDQAWVVKPEKTRVQVFKLVDLDAKSLGDPQCSIAIPANRKFGGLWFHNGKPAIARLYDDDSNSHLFKCQAGNEITLQELPNADDHSVIGFHWTGTSEILIATYDLETARVYKLSDDSRWRLVSSATETSGAVMFDPYFALLDDETPIVTWEAFFPHRGGD